MSNLASKVHSNEKVALSKIGISVSSCLVQMKIFNNKTILRDLPWPCKLQKDRMCSVKPNPQPRLQKYLSCLLWQHAVSQSLGLQEPIVPLWKALFGKRPFKTQASFLWYIMAGTFYTQNAIVSYLKVMTVPQWVCTQCGQLYVSSNFWGSG